MNNKNGIVKKLYYAFEVELNSPLNVSSGDSYSTDCDVIRNASGELFVPGTSIAGAIREALNLKENEDGIMGYTCKTQGKMSSIFISDMYFTGEKTKVSIRDGVHLNKDKTVDNKFDNEIIETGAKAIIYIKCIIRQNTEDIIYKNAIQTLINKIQSGEFRLGNNKTRGYGRLEIVKAYGRYFDIDKKPILEEYLKFVQNEKDIGKYKDLEKYDEQFKVPCKDSSLITNQSEYITIDVPLKLTGGISIRKYSTRIGEADYEHITCNGKPVIPGSSWNGAIRADVYNILHELDVKNSESIINQWFGCIKDKNQQYDKGDAHKSLITFEESVIDGAVGIPVSRNRISRFSAATINSALYTEFSYFGGTTDLTIRIKKTDDMINKAIMAVLSIVIDDIQNGYVAIGGLTSIGRGVFEPNADVKYSEEIDANSNMDALYSVLFH